MQRALYYATHVMRRRDLLVLPGLARKIEPEGLEAAQEPYRSLSDMNTGPSGHKRQQARQQCRRRTHGKPIGYHDYCTVLASGRP
jgi:hypothetical protein